MYKVKASSLTESVLSLALVSIAIVISMMVFSNLFDSFHKRVIELEIRAKIDSIKIEIEQRPNNYHGGKEFNFRDYRITTNLEDKSDNLLLVSVLVEKNEREVLLKKYLIANEKK